MIINVYTVSAFVSFISSIFFGFFVIYRDRKNPRNISFFLLSIMIAFWNLFHFLWQNSSDNPELVLLQARIWIIFVILIGPTFFHFTLAMTENLKKMKWMLVFVYFFFSLFVVTDLFGFFVKEVRWVPGFGYSPVATIFFTAIWVSFTVLTLYCFYLYIQKYKNSSGVIKLQIKYVTIGAFITFVAGSFNFFPWYGISIPAVANIFIPAYVLLMVYGITRYKLMDIRLMAKNVFLFLGVAMLVYTLFYAVAFFYRKVFGDIFSQEGYFMSIFLTIISMAIIYRSNKYISNFINKHFFASIYNYHKKIENISKELSHYADLDVIVEIISKSIKEIMMPESMAILFADRPAGNNIYLKNIKNSGFTDNIFSISYEFLNEYFQKKPGILIKDELNQLVGEGENKKNDQIFFAVNDYINKNQIFICAPLFSGENLSGLILLGYKENGDPYSQEDINFLEILSNQAQTSIDNALLYQNVKKNNEELKELLNVRDDFIRVAHHQLNTPLSIMKNAYSMVKDGSLSCNKAMYYMVNGMQRMDKTVKDFWNTFQSDKEEKGGLNIQKTDITLLIKNIVKEKNSENLLSESKNKKVKTLIEKADFSVPFVLCDAEKIEYVVYNLLDNAVFYTNKGKVVVSYQLIKDGNYLQINIKDTGIGFSKEYKDKISQKFFRSKEALLAHPDGSGLGLYVSKDIVESNKGKLTFDSEGVGKGSTFSFTLPVYKTAS